MICRNVQQLEHLEYEISKQQQMKESYLEAKQKVINDLNLLVSVCQKQHLVINPQAVVGFDHTNVILNYKKDVCVIIENAELNQQENFNVCILKQICNNFLDCNLQLETTDEDKWFPPPYNSLLTKTPQTQQTTSPAPQPTPGKYLIFGTTSYIILLLASEDDEEVPSRGFLKRQAQIVVDAKLRRKNIRMAPKRK